MTTPTVTIGSWTVAVASITSADGAAVLRDYFVEIVSRYHRREMIPAEIDAVLREFPSDDLAPPTGVFLLARPASTGSPAGSAETGSPVADPAPAGCVGIRLLGAGTAELTRLYVRPEHRGRGCGAALLDAAERTAFDLGADRMRLDTRHDLVEARALYARQGYAEVPRHNDDPYAEHWFAKRLR